MLQIFLYEETQIYIIKDKYNKKFTIVGLLTHVIFFKSSDIALPNQIKVKLTKEEFKILFGKQLEQLRIKQNLTYRSMAERCDIDSSDISKIEKGKVEIQLKTIFELSKGLGRHPKELFDFDVDFEKE